MDELEHEVKRLMDFFNITRSESQAQSISDWWGRNRGDYLEALEDLPWDLMHMAMRRARRDLTYMPRPAEIRALVSSELARRQLAKMRLQTAGRIARSAIARPKPDAEVRPSLAVADVIQKITAAREMPIDKGDLE